MCVQNRGTGSQAKQHREFCPRAVDSLHVLFIINVWPLNIQKPFTVAIVIGHPAPRSQPTL